MPAAASWGNTVGTAPAPSRPPSTAASAAANAADASSGMAPSGAGVADPIVPVEDLPGEGGDIVRRRRERRPGDTSEPEREGERVRERGIRDDSRKRERERDREYEERDSDRSRVCSGSSGDEGGAARERGRRLSEMPWRWPTPCGGECRGDTGGR